MKRSTRNVIIVAACAAALGVAAIILQKTGGAVSSSSSAVSSDGVQLVSKSSNDVASMKVTNQKGTYTIVPMVTQNLTASSGSSKSAAAANYTVKELAGCPIDTGETSAAVKNGFSLSASKEIGTVSTLQDYGLSDPQATVLVTFKDGSTYGYKIGNQTATSAGSYYICSDKSSKVYVVAIDAGLLEAPTYFVQKQMISLAGDNVSSSAVSSNSSSSYNFTQITLSGTAYPTGVKLQPKAQDAVRSSNAAAQPSLSIVAPDEYETDSTNVQSLETSLTSLTADSVVAVNPDAATLKQDGFDQPTAVAEYTVNKKNYKLIIGAQNGASKYYAMVGSVPVIYSVTSDGVSGLVSQSLFALRSKMIYLPNIKNVKKVTVLSGTDKTEIDVTRTEKAASSASSSGSEKEYDYKVSVNGKQLDYDTNYRNAYELLISLALYDQADKQPPDTKPTAEIRYEYFDKSGTDAIEFYQSTTRRYTAVFNGKVYGICSQSDVDKAVQTIKDFAAGKAISSSI